jgi:acyl-CoA thioester hydrolase
MAHTIKVKIYYENTDAGGVVYYGNYLALMERARTEYLADRGIDIAELHNDGLFFVVAHVVITYKKPTRLGETIDVTTEVVEIRHASMIIRNCVYKEGVLRVEAMITVACVDREGRARRLPESILRMKP